MVAKGRARAHLGTRNTVPMRTFASRRGGPANEGSRVKVRELA